MSECGDCGNPLDNVDPDQGDDQWFCPLCKANAEIVQLQARLDVLTTHNKDKWACEIRFGALVNAGRMFEELSKREHSEAAWGQAASRLYREARREAWWDTSNTGDQE